MRIGLISDTHGVWHPAIPDLFHGVEAILHAGDVGSPTILQRLESVAPLYAVRGNCDSWPLISSLPRSRTVELKNVRIGLLHGDQFGGEAIEEAVVAFFKDDPVHVVVHGHTHVPCEKKVGSVVVINPGALAPPLNPGRTVAVLEVTDPTNVVVHFHQLS